MKICIASPWAAVGLFASLAGCADVLGFQNFSVEQGDASVGTSSGSDSGTGSDSGGTGADSSLNSDAKSGSGSDAGGGGDATDDAPMTVTGSDGGCSANELNCGTGCVPNDTHNCGTCGHDCTNLSNVVGAVSCSGGACSFDAGACKSGFAHCSGSADLGCETNVTTQAACGACGQTCGTATPDCAGSGTTYSCTSGCPAATPTLCVSSCVATATDGQNCGKCNNPCTTAVAHASATCSGGTCGYACTASYPNSCPGKCVDFQSDNNNCGGCGTVCSTTVIGATSTCVNGNCKTACTNSANTICGSLCTNLQGTDTANCGACGHACSPGTCAGSGQCAKWSVLAAATNNFPGPIATDGNYVAWGNQSPGQCFIVAAPGATLGLAPTAFGNATTGKPYGVAMAGGQAMCLEYGTADEIWSIAEGGLAPTQPAVSLSGNDLGQPSGLALNATATQAFFQNDLLNPGGADYIYQCSLSFSSSCSSIGNYAVTFGPNGYRDIALGGSFVYAAEGTVGNLGQWSLTGSTTQNVATAQGAVQAVTSDASYIYWAFEGSSGTFGISRVPQSNPTASPSVLATGIGGQGLQLATDGTNVYFSALQGSTYSIEYIPAAGGSPVALSNTATTDIIEDIALAKGVLVWSQVPTSGQNGSIWGRHL